MLNDKVTVVIVNWDRKDDLKECIESVINQTYKNIEIVVVDNHSTDGSIDFIRAKFPEIKLIIMPDSSYGACETFNIGFINSGGKYVVIMDNDATLNDNWIEYALIEFNKCEKLGCIAGRVLNYYTRKDWAFDVYGQEESWVNRSFYTTVFLGCSAIIRKDILKEIGGYPKDYFIYHNEFALGAKIINKGFLIKYVPNLISYHKVSPLQRISKRGYYYNTRNWYWYLWTYYPITWAAKYSAIHFIKSFYGIYKFPSEFFKVHLDVLLSIPKTIRQRQPIEDTDLLKPRKW